MIPLYSILAFLLAMTLLLLLWPVRRHKRLCLLIALAISVGACGVYALLGVPDIVPLLAARQQKIELATASIAEHSERVKNNPKDLSAWVALGQDFAETGQWNAAANAFKQAVILSGGNATIIMAYAKSMIFAEDGTVSANSKKSLEMVLLQEPDNGEAKYYLAVYQLQNGNTAAAMKAMKALYHSLPDESPLKAMINRQIGK